jgi:hypothetical protein
LRSQISKANNRGPFCSIIMSRSGQFGRLKASAVVLPCQIRRVAINQYLGYELTGNELYVLIDCHSQIRLIRNNGVVKDLIHLKIHRAMQNQNRHMGIMRTLILMHSPLPLIKCIADRYAHRIRSKRTPPPEEPTNTPYAISHIYTIRPFQCCRGFAVISSLST